MANREYEVEYVEGDYELEEEEDIEDFGASLKDEIMKESDSGKRCWTFLETNMSRLLFFCFWNFLLWL